MVAESLANMKVGGKETNSANLQNCSQSDAAKKLNVSPRSVATACAIKQTAEPEVVQAVHDGNQRKLAAARYAIEREREGRERQGTRTDLTSGQICHEVEFVRSLNDQRRHLDGNQRKLAAARYAIELEREGKERQAAIGTANLTGKCVSNDTDLEIGYSRDKAAEKFNESPATVARAVKVLKEGSDELVKAVERGDVSVSAAADVATLSKPEQAEIVARRRQDHKRKCWP